MLRSEDATWPTLKTEDNKNVDVWCDMHLFVHMSVYIERERITDKVHLFTTQNTAFDYTEKKGIVTVIAIVVAIIMLSCQTSQRHTDLIYMCQWAWVKLGLCLFYPYLIWKGNATSISNNTQTLYLSVTLDVRFTTPIWKAALFNKICYNLWSTNIVNICKV